MGLGPAALVYAGIAALLFRNLLPHLHTHLYSDLGDPLLTASVIAWNAKHIPLTDAWWNFPSFAPLAGVTAFTEHLLLTYPIASPIVWLTGNPILAHNVVYVAALPLNAVSAFTLARELTKSSAAAFVGGLAYALSPYQAVHLSHVQLMLSFGMPIALLWLHRYLSTGHRRALVWFAASWLITALSNAYVLIFFPILAALWSIWFVRPGERRRLVSVATVAAVALLPVVPLLWGYGTRHALYGLARSFVDARSLSADMVGLVGMYHHATAWRGLLTHDYLERALFPGFTIALLAVAALVASLVESTQKARLRDIWARRDGAVFLGMAVVVLWLLALGPVLQWMSPSAIFPVGPYRLLMMLPGFDAIRVPARVWLLAVLCLAMLAACGTQVLIRKRPRWTFPIVAAIAAMIAVEGWFAASVVPVPRPMRPGAIPEGAVVLDLPLEAGYANAVPQYRAVLGGYRTINGYSGYEPAHFAALRQAISNAHPGSLDPYRRDADLYVIIRPGVDTGVRDWIRTTPGGSHVYDVGDAEIYRLAQKPAASD